MRRLTDIQVGYLEGLHNGRRASELALERGVSQQSTAESLRRVCIKLGVHTVPQAVAVWSRHKALLDVADLIDAANPKTNPNPTLTVLVQDCRALAERLIP